jgi:hypothetical protein
MPDRGKWLLIGALAVMALSMAVAGGLTWIYFFSGEGGWERPQGFDISVVNQSGAPLGQVALFINGEAYGFSNGSTEPSGRTDLRSYFADPNVVVEIASAPGGGSYSDYSQPSPGPRYVLFSGHRDVRMLRIHVVVDAVGPIGVLTGTVTVDDDAPTPLRTPTGS